jgi:non-ribosomal peptide synthetase component F
MWFAQARDPDGAAYAIGEYLEIHVVLSLPVLGRRPEGARTPAMTSNVLPIRVALDGQATPVELARRIARERQKLQPHERYRGEHLLRELSGGAVASFGPTVTSCRFATGSRLPAIRPPRGTCRSGRFPISA